MIAKGRHFGLAAAALAIGIGGTLFVERARATGAPVTNALVYVGNLALADGTMVSGTKNIGVAVFDAEANGNRICDVMSAPTVVNAGRFQIALPDTCAAGIKAKPNLWIEVQVEGGSIGRSKLGAVPYAIESTHATAADTAAEAAHAAAANSATSAASVTQAGAMPGLGNLIQSGVDAHSANEASWGLYADSGPRSFQSNVTFSTPFPKVPQVIVGLNKLDSKDDGTTTRFTVDVSNVTTTGFTITYSTWAGSWVYAVGVSWIAYVK